MLLLQYNIVLAKPKEETNHREKSTAQQKPFTSAMQGFSAATHHGTISINYTREDTK